MYMTSADSKQAMFRRLKDAFQHVVHGTALPVEAASPRSSAPESATTPSAAPSSEALASAALAPVELSPEQQAALAEVNRGHPLTFITGRAGTGKSTLIAELRKRGALVCAPTGIAALNCKGVTLHSMFKIPPAFCDPRRPLPSTLNGLSRIPLLVIDEISMVRADVLDFVDATLRFNLRSKAPFGGIRVVFVGDCRQLPPVVTEEEREALQARYESEWFFDALCLKDQDLKVVELTQVHRQKDSALLEILDCVRKGAITPKVLAALNARCIPAGEDALLLTARRFEADSLNQRKLQAIAAEERVYEAQIEGAFSKSEANFPAPRRLALKVGARVLVTKSQGVLVNGTRAQVVRLSPDSVEVEVEGSGARELVLPALWEQHKYVLRDDCFVAEVCGTYQQIPLTLGWAVTVHKSQGMTLPRARVDLGRGAFAAGQAYVALSRTRTMESLSASRAFRNADFILDERVSAFYARHHLT